MTPEQRIAELKERLAELEAEIRKLIADLDKKPLPWIANDNYHGTEESQFMWWCNECTRPFFPTNQGWGCPHCGHYDGDCGFSAWSANDFSGERLDSVRRRLGRAAQIRRQEDADEVWIEENNSPF